MLDQQRLLSLRRHFDLCWHVTHPHSWREFCGRFLSGTCWHFHSFFSYLLSRWCPHSPVHCHFLHLPAHMSIFLRLTLQRADQSWRTFFAHSFDIVRPGLLPISLPVLARLVLPHRDDAIKSSHANHTSQYTHLGPPRIAHFSQVVGCQFSRECTAKFPFQFEDESSHLFFIIFPRGFLMDWFKTQLPI